MDSTDAEGDTGGGRAGEAGGDGGGRGGEAGGDEEEAGGGRGGEAGGSQVRLKTQ